ncbi:MAG: NapC/NirT family cytochrome c [Phycisphaerae bacterium]|nr:NapC/NirT family cytochrome c [Phycisphaerae bacterium]
MDNTPDGSRQADNPLNHPKTNTAPDVSSPEPATSPEEPQADPGTRSAGPAPYRPKHPPYWENTITVIGAFLAAMAVLLLVTFGLFTLVSPAKNPYVDIVGYIILPGLILIGLLLMPLGILVKSWRIRRKDPTHRLAFRFPRVDLNDPGQRRMAKVFVFGTFLLLPIVGVSSYQGYHYTDSSEFCGKVCHSVMEPQATAYENSPHARVSCAECHIGSGASWFVKSKLSGTRQVLAVWMNSFPRPIPPAITELRPARETCEECHWPKKFFGAQLKSIEHFSADEENTRHAVNMLIKTGGGDEETGRASGIHRHMALEGQIEYIATDEFLQEVPWVRYVTRAGEVLIYRSDGRPSSDPPPLGTVRKIDCMDCHNRAAHKFQSPQEAVNLRLATGKIDRTLPFIKREVVAALVRPYPDEESAMRLIAASLTDYYRVQHPDVWSMRKASVNNAIDVVRDIYLRNFFPKMRVDWRTYPDNVGHFYSPGCFRCHDGKHVDHRGEVISHQCDVCHTFLNAASQKQGGNQKGAGAGLQDEVASASGKQANEYIIEGSFIHPVELVGIHKDLACHLCHTGGITPEATCTGCHSGTQALRAGTDSDFSRFDISPEPMFDDLGCEDCHDVSKPLNLAAMNDVCLSCHDDEKEKFDGLVNNWREEVHSLRKDTAEALMAVQSALKSRPDSATEEWLDKSFKTFNALNAAIPEHNMDASRKIYEALRTEAEAKRAALPTAPASAPSAKVPTKQDAKKEAPKEG